MADIMQELAIQAPPVRVFDGISTPAGLNQWWTKTAAGSPAVGETFELGFGPGYDWRAVVTKAAQSRVFELRMTEADSDWTGTLVGFELSETTGGTRVRFTHRGWPEPKTHYRTSCHCWALYLRILRRYLEHGETVPYERRLEA